MLTRPLPTPVKQRVTQREVDAHAPKTIYATEITRYVKTAVEDCSDAVAVITRQTVN